MRFVALCFIKFYQNYISKMTPNSCRYYPTCSEYAIWAFNNTNFFTAFFITIVRILKCNQLFKGGIDYPIVYKKFNPFFVFTNINLRKITFWFVRYKGDRFYVIKSF